jgi:PAS domain S-box-containing protein
MESITGRRPLPAALRRGITRTDRNGFVLGLAVLAAAVIVDAALGPTGVLVGTFVLAPFVPAVLGSVFSTVLVGTLTIVAGFVSPAWNTDFGDAAYWTRCVEIIIGSGFAIAVARGRQRARISSQRLALLDSVGAIADGSLPLAETLERVVEMIVPAAADFCMIDAIREGQVVRAAVRARGRPDEAAIEDRLRHRKPSLPKRFITPERAWLQIAHFRRRMDAEDLRRMAQNHEDLEFLESIRPRSSIIAGMTARGRSLGTLTMVNAWSKRHYSTDDVRFAQLLANRIALALDNAGLFSDLESVERRLDAVMSMLDEPVMIHHANGDLVYANDAAAGWLGFASPQDALDAKPRDLAARFEAWTEDGVSVKAELIATRLREGSLPHRQVVRIALRASGEERWAVVSAEPIEGPDGRRLYAVTTVKDVTELKRSEFAQQLLARTGELLASSIDYRETLQAVARLAVPQFADWCTVNIPDRNGLLERVAIAHIDPERIAVADRLRERYSVRIDDPGPLAEVIRTGEPRLITDIPQETLERGDIDEEQLHLIRGVRTGSAIAAPMTAGSKVVGALVFVNDLGSRRFDEGDLALALEIARRASLAVENARLADAQAEVARVLQEGLMPPELPDLRGFDLASMYRPAGEVNEVGGDFYDAFEIDGGWMIAMGDVMGQGAAAASLTGLARYTIRTAGRLTGDPFLAASLVDDSLKHGPELLLCSAVILVLPDSADDPVRISVLVAGHPPPLRVRSGGIEAVGRTGPLLGAPDEHRWEVTTVELTDRDQLVLYTDGVTEARGENDRFGEERLRAILAPVGDPGAAVATVESALDSFLDGDPDDDAAMLAIMRSTPSTLAVGRFGDAAARQIPRAGNVVEGVSASEKRVVR